MKTSLRCSCKLKTGPKKGYRCDAQAKVKTPAGQFCGRHEKCNDIIHTYFEHPKVTGSKTNKGILWAKIKFDYKNNDANTFLMRKISNSTYDFMVYEDSGAGDSHWQYFSVIDVVKPYSHDQMYDDISIKYSSLYTKYCENDCSEFDEFKAIFPAETMFIMSCKEKAQKESLKKDEEKIMDLFFECGYNLATRNNFIDITKAIL